jgi:5-methylcytosine-specific restriction endonuclease McrA
MTKEQKQRKLEINRIYRKRNKKKLRAKRAANLDARYHDLKLRAKRDGRKFRISKKRYKEMIKSGCNYCGKSIMGELGGSLDRVNNKNRNYTTLNVVPSCTSCNLIKSKYLNREEMEVAMKAVIAYRESKKNG